MSFHERTPEQRRESALKGGATRRANIAIRENAKRGASEKVRNLKAEIAALEGRAREAREFVTMCDAAGIACGKTLLRADEIVDAAKPWQTYCGVYFLRSEGEVVYVGQSVNVFSRISNHREKKFDSFTVVPCEREHLDSLESLYIHTLRPKLNGWVGHTCAPIPLHKLLKGTT
jgi:hypothetical protein